MVEKNTISVCSNPALFPHIICQRQIKIVFKKIEKMESGRTSGVSPVRPKRGIEHMRPLSTVPFLTMPQKH